MSQEHHIQKQKDRVVGIANGVLAGQIGIIEGARKLAYLRWKVTDDEFDPDFIPFVAVDSETDALPIGEERARWTSNALAEKDREIKHAEDFYREKILAACRVLLTRYTCDADVGSSMENKQMNQDQAQRVTKVIEAFLKKSNARAALVCEANGSPVVGSGTYSNEDRKLVLELAPGVFPGTRRMAEKLNVNEAQMVSIPDDNIYILIFWVAQQYFFLIFYRAVVNPHAPPQNAIEACKSIRTVIQPASQQRRKFWKQERT